MKNGAVEFLQKTADTALLIEAVIRAVGRSEAGFANLAVDPLEARRRVSLLTERELEVVQLVASGLLNRQVAEKLHLSVRTAENYRAAAARKLGVRSAAELTSLLSLAEIH